MTSKSLIDKIALTFSFTALVGSFAVGAGKSDPPNIVLVMSDDQGWGQAGCYNHPFLKTPNLDAMAKNGLRFKRFYAGAPVCSPTRACLLTGRTNDRTGVFSHGYALRLQEKTLAPALKDADYATGHFGKWHLNGLRGPGAPVLAEDSHNPGAFGFGEWLSVTNFFDMNPLMSRGGTFEEFEGDSSEIIIQEALKFIKNKNEKNVPSLSVIWYGTPHSPWKAYKKDKKDFDEFNEKVQEHYGELVAMDRSIGTLRRGLREMGIAENTLLWFNSDNGGLNLPETVGGLRGHKGSVWEGGLRVPGIIEWPGTIKPRVTDFPASVMDIFPTLVELLNLPEDSITAPADGMSLLPLFTREIDRREKPIPFQFKTKTVLIDNDYKIIYERKKKTKNPFRLYNLVDDPKETTDVFNDTPGIADDLKKQVTELARSIEKSISGADYPAGKITTVEPKRMFWANSPAYQKHLDELSKRPEYAGHIAKKTRNAPGKQKK